MGTALHTDIKDINSIKSEITRKFPELSLSVDSARSHPRKLASCIPEVDNFLEGGLPFDGMTEFGMPLGREGRLLLLKFLANATCGIRMNPVWTLWAYSHEELSVFPPAWFSKGVSPSRIVFARCSAPAQDLKRAMINPFFRVIILDSPHLFTRDDCFFVNTQARFNHQLVILLRDFFLSNKRGNVWAKLRLNCWKRHSDNRFFIRTVRGLPRRQLVISEEILK